MSNKKNLKIIGELSENKSKNALPLIGSAKKTNKNNNIANNNSNKINNFQNSEQAKIEFKGKQAESQINNNQIKNSKKEDENLKKVEIDRNNYKLIYSRNNNNVNNLSPIHKTINKNNNLEVINELGKTEIRQNKIFQKNYKIIFVFRNEDFYITVKSNSTIKNVRLAISKLINLDIKQIGMMYEDKEIDMSNDEKTVNDYFNFQKLRSRPIIYIKKKFVSNNNLNEDNFSNFLFKKTYNNRVKIANFPITSDTSIPTDENINNIINNFFKNNPSLGDAQKENNLYKIETGNENLEDKKDNITYIIGFSSPDLAFDFNRYLTSLKLINPIYKDIKSNIISVKKRNNEFKIANNSNNNSPKGNLRYGIDYNLDENNLTKRNSNILKLIRNNYLQKRKLKKEKNNSQIYVNISGPYLSLFDKERIEEKENKKKWINPLGFISCVGKYSGIQL